MIRDEKFVDAVGYLVVREGAPLGRSIRGLGARLTSVTQHPPSSLPLGSIAMKVRIRIPKSAFRPEVAEAVVTVPEQDLILPEISVESERDAALGDLQAAMRTAEDLDAALEGVRVCVHCGCTDDRACIDETGRPCYWVAQGVCSACADGGPCQGGDES